ncbi:MAG TPA: HDIG domain-containing protein [Victivallales bacterium]|nr:HDIG domain-containing protein [Victivallales bacterium]
MSLFGKSLKRRKLEKEGLASTKKRLKQDQTIGYVINKSKFVSFIILFIVWFVCAMILIVPSSTGKYGFYLVEGQQAPKTVYSELSFVYLDKIATNQRRDLAKKSVPAIYEINNKICEKNLEEADNTLKNLSNVIKKNDKGKATSNIQTQLISPLLLIAKDKRRLDLFNSKLANILYRGIIQKKDQDNLNKTRNYQICIIDRNNHIRPKESIKNIPTPEKAAKEFANAVVMDYSPENRSVLRQTIYSMALNFISPNLTYNKGLTEVEQNLFASSSKNEVYKEVNKGDLILKKGEKVTPDLLEKFLAYEKEKSKKLMYANFWENFTYNLLISFILTIITAIYFYNLYPKLLLSNQKMGTIAAVIILSVIAIFISIKIFIYFAADYNLPNSLITCIIPLALAPVLLSVLIGLRAATFASLLVAFIAALKIQDYNAIIVGMALCCFTAYFVHGSRNYKEYFVKSVISISLVLIPIELFGQLKLILATPDLIPWFVLLSIVNGIITGIVALALLFIIESIFKISTDMSLLSLCDYNHPLLKRLQLEAPGTYHHCLVVATLAEQACEAIGANPIKARVCALFHDIGKLSKPEYFTENNIASANRHGTLKPGMSSMIIMNHVKEGMNLAIKHKLSYIIRAAIEQHHGTDLVYFFYRRALEEHDEKTKLITEKEYRYPGPKPIEKEVVILSLADVCEAASRSLEKPTPSKIETLVWEIIRKKIREGQLDNANLTFNELAKAKASFIKTLNSMLHTRISYPSDEENKNEDDLFQAAKKQNKNIQKNIQ